MSSQLSYRLHGREQRPKTLRKHYRDELDTGQVKASAKEPRACSARRLVMGRSQFSARAPTASSGALQQVEGALDARDHAGGDAGVARRRVQFVMSQRTRVIMHLLLTY